MLEGVVLGESEEGTWVKTHSTKLFPGNLSFKNLQEGVVDSFRGALLLTAILPPFQFLFE